MTKIIISIIIVASSKEKKKMRMFPVFLEGTIQEFGNILDFREKMGQQTKHVTYAKRSENMTNLVRYLTWQSANSSPAD